MLRVNPPPLKLSVVTTQDSEGNAMLKAHAYLAQSDGEVSAYVRSTGGSQFLNGYIGSTSDPAGAGDLIHPDSIDPTDMQGGVSFLVDQGKYFELTTDSANAVTIRWRSFGPLKKPVDFN